MSEIGRSLVVKRAWVPAILGLIALASTGLFIWGVAVDHRIHVRTGLMMLLFWVLTPLSLTYVFPRVCKRCRVGLETRIGAYPAEAFEALSHAVETADMNQCQSLASARSMVHIPHRAAVELEVCPACQVVGTVRVHEQVYGQNRNYDTKRSSSELALDSRRSAAALALAG